MTNDTIDAAAAVLYTQHREKAPHSPLRGELAPTDIKSAYQIQFALQQRYLDDGEQIAGWKVALTTPVMQALVGVDHPCAGAIFTSRLHRAPANLAADDYVRIGLEAEIAVELANALPPVDGGYTADSVRPHINALIPALEIVDDRGCDYPSMDAPQLIADNSFNFGCVLGQPVTDWQAIELAAETTHVAINGEEVGSGSGRDVLGHPLNALSWLANQLNDYGRTLPAGSIVMTGSLVKTQWPEVGQTMRHALSTLGTIEATIV